MSQPRRLALAAALLALLISPPALSLAQDSGGGSAGTEEPLAGVGAGPGAVGASPDGSDPASGAGDPGPGTAPAPAATAPAPAASAAAPRAGKAGSASVSIGDNFYSPASVTINVGDTVTWTNNGQVSHSATADDGSFDTGVFGPGGSRSHTFNSPGTFSYYCTVHGKVQSGSVRVARRGGGGGSGATTGGTEAAAVAAPGAAGSNTSLAATGNPTWLVALIGALLLGAGLGLRHRVR